jgi:putative nucleotidyltransferase with HDIG domain
MSNHAGILRRHIRAPKLSSSFLDIMPSAEILRYALTAVYVVPLLVIAYIYMQYIYPMFAAKGDEVLALGISAVLTLGVIVSILGLALISSSAKSSVDTLMSLNQRMDMVLTFTKSFGETGHVDMLVDSVARSAKEVLNAEASSLMLYDDAGNLRFEYVEGTAAHMIKGKVLKPGEGIAGWAARERAPVIVNDVKSDKRFAHQFDGESGFNTTSIICVPLVFNDRDLGVLEVINKRGGIGFTESDKHTLLAFAEHAAAAIYRNKAFDEIKSDFVQVTDFLVMAMDGPMPEKKGHSKRVARYSVKLAKGMGMKDDDVRSVYFGSLLHDIGLLKFDSADTKDREKYKMHSSFGCDMVKNVYQWKDVSRMIRDHHERYDGSGYPVGLVGEEISLGGRIIGLAEAFDVMTSSTSYKEPVSFDDAVDEIKNLAGYQFDPDVVDVFLRIFTKDDLVE